MKDVNDDDNGFMGAYHVVNDFHTVLFAGMMSGCQR